MPPEPGLADRIDALLPQTQCRRCGEDGCRSYAEAITRGVAPINRCPPGGQATLAALAALLRVPAPPLDESRGTPQPFALACIDEAVCIGCTLCIHVCPTDAIVGAAKQMHTVLADRCTGCELCLPPCPVDCLAMLPAGREWTPVDADLARERYAAHRSRLAAGPAARKRAYASHTGARAQRLASVAAALQRARARRGPVGPAER